MSSDNKFPINSDIYFIHKLKLNGSIVNPTTFDWEGF